MSVSEAGGTQMRYLEKEGSIWDRRMWSAGGKCWGFVRFSEEDKLTIGFSALQEIGSFAKKQNRIKTTPPPKFGRVVSTKD